MDMTNVKHRCCAVSIEDILLLRMSQIDTGGAGEGGGFQSYSESALQNALDDANQPFKCKAASLLAANTT